ncbi:MAG TPA: tRNA pseudouridine(38-40) synthase TruA [Acidimicrobiales bacterium]|jgi:tRNA pseudouridine38-40 synthase
MTLFDDVVDVTSGPSGPLVRVKLVVAYDGSGFAGIAPQPGVTTVGGTLAAVLGRVLRQPVQLTVAGRTDAGVHAWGQVVTFDVEVATENDAPVDVVALARTVNRVCGPAIVVRHAQVVDADFDARHSARARCYRYSIVNTPVPNPFLAATAWHVAQPLDLRLLRIASDPLIGEHDFTSFCRKPRVPEGVSFSMTRRVLDTRWHDLGEGVLRFDIEATAFCQQMVRSIVGTLVEVGLGRRSPASVMAALTGSDRALAGPPAPPHGLCLWEVRY